MSFSIRLENLIVPLQNLHRKVYFYVLTNMGYENSTSIKQVRNIRTNLYGERLFFSSETTEIFFILKEVLQKGEDREIVSFLYEQRNRPQKNSYKEMLSLENKGLELTVVRENGMEEEGPESTDLNLSDLGEGSSFRIQICESPCYYPEQNEKELSRMYSPKAFKRAEFLSVVEEDKWEVKSDTSPEKRKNGESSPELNVGRILSYKQANSDLLRKANTMSTEDGQLVEKLRHHYEAKDDSPKRRTEGGKRDSLKLRTLKPSSQTSAYSSDSSSCAKFFGFFQANNFWVQPLVYGGLIGMVSAFATSTLAF